MGGAASSALVLSDDITLDGVAPLIGTGGLGLIGEYGGGELSFLSTLLCWWCLELGRLLIGLRWTMATA